MVTKPPVIISVKDTINVIDSESLHALKVVDSLKTVVIGKDSAFKDLKTNYKFLKIRANQLEYALLADTTNNSGDYFPDVKEYVENSHAKDSVCDSMVVNLFQQLNLKDEVIITKDTSYNSLRKHFDFMAQRQGESEKVNLQLSKENRIAKSINKVLAGATVAAILVAIFKK